MHDVHGFFLKQDLLKGMARGYKIWRAELFLIRTSLSPYMLLQDFMFLFLDGLARTFHQAGSDCFYNRLLDFYQSYIPGNSRKEADHLDQLFLKAFQFDKFSFSPLLKQKLSEIGCIESRVQWMFLH